MSSTDADDNEQIKLGSFANNSSESDVDSSTDSDSDTEHPSNQTNDENPNINDSVSDEKIETSNDDDEEDTSSKYRVDHPLAVRYLDHSVEVNKFSIDTADHYASALRQYIAYLKEVDLTVIDAKCTHIEDFLSRWKNFNRESTLKMKLAAIRGFYKYIAAYKPKLDHEINFFALDMISPPSSNLPTMTRESITEEEVKKLLNEIANPRDRLMVLLAVLRGPRNSAIRELKLEDVSLGENSIVLQDMKDNDEYKLPAGRALSDYFEHWLNNVRPTYPDSEENPYVFPSKQGGMISNRETFTKIVREAAKEAGIQDTMGKTPLTDEQIKHLKGSKKERVLHSVTPHTLRHTFNELLKNRDVPLEIRSHLLNHNSVEVTRKFYDDDIEDVDDFLKDIADFL